MSADFGTELISLLPNLRRFAISLCKSREVADDLVQITCEKALANQGRYETGTRLDAWLFRIMRNSWIDRIRKSKTEGIAVDIDDSPGIVGTDGSKVAENRLMLNETAKAIESLPDEQREVLMLVTVEELSYRETSEALDIPIGTVMSRLARARQSLHDSLGIKPAPGRSSDRKGKKP